MHAESTPDRRPGGHPRRVGALALLACAALLAFSALSASTARAELPPQGVYEQCAPNSTTIDCGQRLKTIAAAGFKYVLNYTAWFGNAQQVRHYADQAQAAGVKLIWPLNDPAWRDGTNLKSYYEYLGPSCGCSSNSAFKQFALGLVKDHPSTWGFYIGDEVLPTPQNVSQVSALSQEVKSIAPNRPTLYVAMPRDNEIGTQLQPFASLADYAGTDYYPVVQNATFGGLSAIAQRTRSIAAEAGKSPVMVLQAFSWSQYLGDVDYRFPSRDQMQAMRDETIGSGSPSMMLWYSFNDVMSSRDPADNWRALRAAAFAPYVSVSGARGRCSAKQLRVRVVAQWKLKQARALVDGRRRVKTTRESFRVRTHGLGAGVHRLRILAADNGGNATKHLVRFRTC